MAEADIWQGYWDIKDKARISYIIDKDMGSVFNFSASVGIFEEDYIKYKLGIGLSGRSNPAKRIITLFGNWRIKKDAGLFFEIAYENKKVNRHSLRGRSEIDGQEHDIFKAYKCE